MLTGMHLLLTYACNYECDHCFLYCGPHAKGTFTVGRLGGLLHDAARMGGIELVYFEGGEPFLFYPLMIEGIRMARELGFQTGVVTNAYWATSAEDAELWLRPLAELGVADVSLSDDAFHHGAVAESPAKVALAAARALGLRAGTICIEAPRVERIAGAGQGRGALVVGDGVMFRGRAVEKLTAGLPRRPWDEFTRCPHEDLREPSRVHIDPYGHVHLCQGLTMGSLEEAPLPSLVRGYDPLSHPICGPLLRGGPALLAREYDIDLEPGYVDACHLCYHLRLALIDRFPQYLGPRQVYGLE